MTDELKATLESWANTVKTNSQIEFIESLFHGALAGSATVDRFSTWLLAGTGATVALMISNMSGLLTVMQPSSLKTSIALLVVSALFGFMAKYKSIQCHVAIESAERIKLGANSVMAKHSDEESKIQKMAEEHGLEIDTGIDFDYVLIEYKKAIPSVLRWLARRQIDAAVKDRLAPSRKAANGFIWQSNYTALQFFAFLGFVFTAILSIEKI